MAEGRIKWYSEDKGYGFIEAEDGNEIFFHKNNVDFEGHFGLRKSDRVSFEVEMTPRGQKALNVKAL
ncbi:MAG: cold shock domain-containing protein [Desulfobacterales bacterium]|jgi:CspA family cold shock protein